MASGEVQGFGASLKLIDNYLTDFKLKKDLTWGFVVYRCSYSDQAAWERMLQLLRTDVESSLEAEGRMDLLPRHELIVMDDASQFDGATSHVVRDHFIRWVADEVMDKLLQPTEEQRELILRNEPAEGPEWSFGTRYNFCLFVDDICLESLDKMHEPVVKILWKQWGSLTADERVYTVHPEWEDGQTEEQEEEVGWMYMSVLDYLTFYNLFCETHNWYEEYCRPPLMIGLPEEESPGNWRRK